MGETEANDAGRSSRSGRWRRRETRRASRRKRIEKHGASLGKVYRAAVLKRMRDRKRK